MKRIKLTNWTVAGFWPWTPLFGKSMETGFAMSGVTPSIPARVPGSVYDDLLRAGLIQDPEIGMNSLDCEWVANRWWVYECRFDTPEGDDQRTVLRFQGIDYEAVIFLNGQQIAEHKGMYTSCCVDVTGLLKRGEEQNLLLVVIKSAPDEMGQIGYTSRTHTQKARFAYKWDFCSRLVNLGLYDEVVLEQKGIAEVSAPFVRVLDARGGRVHVEAQIIAAQATDADLQINILDENGNLAAHVSYQLGLEKGENSISSDFVIPNPQLWWPNGYGEQPLYRVVIEVHDSCGSDRYECNLGLRDIAYEQCDGAREDSLPYLIRINGRRLYAKGVNLSPLDMLYGCVSEEEYDRFLRDIVRKANINIVRVNGVGLIEKEIFYDLCDRYGILVWQEFIQSSSGIDNIPSKDPEMLELLEKTVTEAVCQKRNHPSLALWDGGNELMSAPDTPATYEDENIAMIKAIVDRLDPDRLFLPTCASGPREFLNCAAPGSNHDVHGPWNYGGPVDHYTMYNTSDSQLHSEMGCNGMSSERTIRHICGPAHLGVLDNGDFVWRHHGEWWNALSRDVDVIGTPNNMTEMISIDQFIQGEALRYAVESNSRRAYQNCGSNIWALNEPWPNVANCSLVDHYYDKKLAYKMVGEAYSPLHASLRYQSLYLAEGEAFTGDIFLHNDRLEDQTVSLRWVATEFGGNELARGETDAVIASGGRSAAGQVAFCGTGKPIFVTLFLSCGEESRENRYLFLPHRGAPDSAERRPEIDAVIHFFHTIDEWALRP